jgi:hypothetical protein
MFHRPKRYGRAACRPENSHQFISASSTLINTLDERPAYLDTHEGVTPGARTTMGTAGKYAAITDRDFRKAAVP